ncbi:MAG TPA: hypothetical protein VL199_03610 [Burkholderiales bacterium]|jgi:hypothetical protein|nr:hypothetical protein [Burkholderiales bacterium]
MKTALFLLLFAGSAHAYDVNGVALGATEKDIRQQFPYANCRPLEWSSLAADRRCDDSRIIFAGVDASVTFYLRKGKVEGFDVRFDHRDIAGIVKFLTPRYGAPAFEGTGPVMAQWKNKAERATITSEQGRRRASLLVSRGTFEDEIYKVR